MTEKPNSVCAKCKGRKDSHVGVAQVCFGGYGTTFTAEPLAEPAEPSATTEEPLKLRCVSELALSTGGRLRCEKSPDHKNDHYGYMPDGKLVQWVQWPARPSEPFAPQPVAGERVNQAVKEAHDVLRGTPKLEEAINQQILKLTGKTPAPGARFTLPDVKSALNGLAESLRPFITPACQKENLCGTANVPISTNTDTHLIAETVGRFEVRHLPDEEWNKLSVESREKISKWFSLAEKYLQAILDEPITPACSPKESK